MRGGTSWRSLQRLAPGALVLIGLLAARTAQAQEEFDVVGIVADSSGVVLNGAMIVALTRPDSVLAKFSLSNGSGEFRLSRLVPGDYILQVTFLGHQNDVDIYTVKIEAPGHSSKPSELRYLGSEIELYKDGEYVITLRPRLTELNQSAEQDAAPNH